MPSHYSILATSIHGPSADGLSEHDAALIQTEQVLDAIDDLQAGSRARRRISCDFLPRSRAYRVCSICHQIKSRNSFFSKRQSRCKQCERAHLRTLKDRTDGPFTL